MILFESQPQISWISVVTLLADRLQIYFVKLCLDSHLLVAGGAGEVVDAPGLVEGSEDVALDDLVAHVAQVAEQLMIVSLTVSQTLPLVMTVAKEWFLTLGAHEVLHAPVFTQGCDHSPLYGSPAGSTDGDTHPIVAPETVQLIELLGCVSWSGSHLPGGAGQLYATTCAVEVVGMIDLASEPQWLLINNRVTLLTHVLAHPRSLHLHHNMNSESEMIILRSYLCIAFMTQCSSLILDEAQISQLLVTHLTAEALGVPGGAHGLQQCNMNDE